MARIGFASASTASITLGWDANPDPSITGYKIHYGVQSKGYTQSLDVGKVTTATVNNLPVGYNYYFVVTDYNASGGESLPSNEVMESIPSPVKQSPYAFKIPYQSNFTVQGVMTALNRGPISTLQGATVVVTAQKVLNDPTSLMWTKVYPNQDLSVPPGLAQLVNMTFRPSDLVPSGSIFYVVVTAADPVTHLAWPVGNYSIQVT